MFHDKTCKSGFNLQNKSIRLLCRHELHWHHISSTQINIIYYNSCNNSVVVVQQHTCITLFYRCYLDCVLLFLPVGWNTSYLLSHPLNTLANDQIWMVLGSHKMKYINVHIRVVYKIKTIKPQKSQWPCKYAAYDCLCVLFNKNHLTYLISDLWRVTVQQLEFTCRNFSISSCPLLACEWLDKLLIDKAEGSDG